MYIFYLFLLATVGDVVGRVVLWQGLNDNNRVSGLTLNPYLPPFLPILPKARCVISNLPGLTANTTRDPRAFNSL